MNLYEIAETLIRRERARHDSLGWTREHDAGHHEELAAAARSYESHVSFPDREPAAWPWSWEYWKPKDARRDLERAGALWLACEAAEVYPEYQDRAHQRFVHVVSRLVSEVLACMSVSELSRLEGDLGAPSTPTGTGMDIRAAVRQSLLDVVPAVDAYRARGRSSMPIYVDDAMALCVAASTWYDMPPASSCPDGSGS